MRYENLLIHAAANAARIPFWLARQQPFVEPRKILILKPCCLSQVMLATPLLAALSEAYPNARIDWAVSDWARPAISGNPRITKLINTGSVLLQEGRKKDIGNLIEALRAGGYDTCFVPSCSTLLSYITWKASIPQRIGLNAGGHGFAYTKPVSVQRQIEHEDLLYLKLARALGIDVEAKAEFYPSDRARSDITRRLVEEIGWQGDRPLVIIHPGGGENPAAGGGEVRWPAERFASLANRLVHKLAARVVFVGSKEDETLVKTIHGLMSAEATYLAGHLDLDHIGTLAEVADLYVGNDAGPTHIAAAVGCRTLVIFGPTNPAVSAPYLTRGKVTIVKPAEVIIPFSWDQGPLVDDVSDAAGKILARNPEGNSRWAWARSEGDPQPAVRSDPEAH